SSAVCVLLHSSVALLFPYTTLFRSRRVDAEVFRRLCMSFDAWIVGFGLSKVLVALGLAVNPGAYLVLLIAVILDTALLMTFFSRSEEHTSELQSPDHLVCPLLLEKQ